MESLYNYGLEKIALSKAPGQSDYDYYTGRIANDYKHSWYGTGAAIAGGVLGAGIGAAAGDSRDAMGIGAAIGATPGLLYDAYHTLRMPYDGIRGIMAETPKGTSEAKNDAARTAQYSAAATLPIALIGGPLVSAVAPAASPAITGLAAGARLNSAIMSNRYNNIKK